MNSVLDSKKYSFLINRPSFQSGGLIFAVGDRCCLVGSLNSTGDGLEKQKLSETDETGGEEREKGRSQALTVGRFLPCDERTSNLPVIRSWKVVI